MLEAQSNPLVVRLVGKSNWLSLRACFWLAFGLGITGLILSAWMFLNGYESVNLWAGMRTSGAQRWVFVMDTFLPRGLTLAPLVFTLLAPIVVVFFAITMTTRDVSSNTYVLMCLTSIPNRDVVSGYIYTAFYRARLLIALAVGLMPVWVVSLLEYDVRVAAILEASREADIRLPYFLFRFERLLEPPTIADILVWLIAIIGLWGMNWLAASLGVAVALRQHRMLYAVIIAPLIIASLFIAFLWLYPPLYMPTLESTPANASLPLLSYPVAYILMRFSEHWARHR